MKISTLLLSGLVTVAGAAMISGQTAFAADAPKMKSQQMVKKALLS